MTAVEFSAKRYDKGTQLGILHANIEVGLKHPEIGEDLRAYLKELATTL